MPLHLLERANPFNVVLDVVLSGELPAFLDVLGPFVLVDLFLELAEEAALIANWQCLYFIFVSFYSFDNSHFFIIILVLFLLNLIDFNIGESFIRVILLVGKRLHLDRLLRI